MPSLILLHDPSCFVSKSDPPLRPNSPNHVRLGQYRITRDLSRGKAGAPDHALAEQRFPTEFPALHTIPLGHVSPPHSVYRLTLTISLSRGGPRDDPIGGGGRVVGVEALLLHYQ